MDSMNENTVRTLLADVADTPEPPSRISIEAARTAGRRRQWANRAIASGATLAVAAVAAAGVMVVPHFRAAVTTAGATEPAAGSVPAAQTASVKPVTPAPAPTRFNPLVLPANFGCPPGFWTEDGASITVTPTLTYVNLVHGQTLKVTARGWYPSDADNGNFATVRGSFPGAATAPKAPPVNGQPAYWTGNGIVWEYAPGAWASLYGAGNPGAPQGRTLDEEMASKVRFGQRQPLYTPFRLTHGLPEGWQVTRTDSVVTNGRPLVWQVQAGPAAHPQALFIVDDPTAKGCQFTSPAPTSWVTADGIRWGDFVTSGLQGDQSACATTRVDDVGFVTMYYYWAGHNQALSLASLVQSMRFLGSNPAGWTANPLAG